MNALKALKVALCAVTAAVSMSSMAGPVIPLPGGPLFIKFENREQIAVGGATTWAGSTEINWGVVRISTVEVGSVVSPHDQVGGSGDIFFANNTVLGGFSQITGIFYDIKSAAGPALSPFPASGGYLDLYWRDVATDGLGGNLSAAFDSTKRTAQDKYTGFTEGTFLARLMFSSGIDPTNSGVTIAGSVDPTGLTSFHGTAASYANVDTSVVGAWTDALNTDWFNTVFGTRDLRFNNNYDSLADWNGGDPRILGAKSDDPAQAVAVPTPAPLALVGVALIGLAAIRRRTV